LWSYIKNYKFNSLFIKNFLKIFFLLMVPMGLIHLLVFQYNDSLMREEIRTSSRSELLRIRDTIDIIMEEIQSLTLRLAYSADVQTLLAKEQIEYPMDYATISQIQRVQQGLKQAIVTNAYVSGIQIKLNESDYMIQESSGGTADKYMVRASEQIRPAEQMQSEDQAGGMEQSRTEDQKTLSEDQKTRSEDESPGTKQAESGGQTLSEHLGSPEDTRGMAGAAVTDLEPERLDASTVGQGPYSIPIMREISGAENGNQGQVTASIDVFHLERLLRKHSPEQQIYIVNRNGRIVYAQEQERAGRFLEAVEPQLWEKTGSISGEAAQSYDAGNRVISAAASSIEDWVYISAEPLMLYQSRQSQLNSFIATLILVAAASGLVLAFLISVSAYQPIRAIHNLLENGSDPRGWWEKDRKHQGALNELRYIASAILRSKVHNEQLEEELERRYEAVNKAQAIALYAQINPHFLYNTLEAINWKVLRLARGKNDASVMLHSLSRLLRLALMTGERIIPLRKELEHAKLYTDLQQLRYGEELEVVWQVDEELLDCSIVKLSLQPLIENAILHGTQPSRRKGIICIRGYQEEKQLVLEIRDNGAGMSPEMAADMNERLKSMEIAEDSHIGLSNVNQRIRLIFGDQYGLLLFSQIGEGTVVVMRLPQGTDAPTKG
jgi:two-component system sensor histidine kinase YesM